jgi:hypothetical protein
MRRAISVCGPEPAQLAAHHDRDPAAARQPVQHLGDVLVAPQC